jgi:hypothetical protein
VTEPSSNVGHVFTLLQNPFVSFDILAKRCVNTGYSTLKSVARIHSVSWISAYDNKISCTRNFLP